MAHKKAFNPQADVPIALASVSTAYNVTNEALDTWWIESYK